MKIALIQQKADSNKSVNLKKGLAAAEIAARNGAQLVAFAELAFEPFYPLSCRKRQKQIGRDYSGSDNGSFFPACQKVQNGYYSQPVRTGWRKYL